MTLSYINYIMFYDDCPIEMREEYEKTNKLPEKPVISGGMTVSKIDKNTNVVLKMYMFYLLCK